MPNPITVTFNGTTVSLPTDADIEVQPGSTDISFNLGAGAPAGAQIVGVEFPYDDEPTGTYDPERVFDHKHTITKDSVTHNLFGHSNGNNLTLTDTDNATAADGEEDYSYVVWVKYNNVYYKSPDPVIKNDPPPHQGG